MSINLPHVSEVSIDDVIANSFRDYHVKGFDYICLRRSLTETIKLYFFDGDVSKLPEVVNPHDHRYDFNTLCIAGEVENIWFRPSTDDGEVFQAFEYRTPLNGGAGFEWAGEKRLEISNRLRRTAGACYGMWHEELHTIRMVQNETVLCLTQYRDRVPVDQPTMTYVRDREPPSLSGLYSRFTADQIIYRLLKLKDRVPGLLLPRIV